MPFEYEFLLLSALRDFNFSPEGIAAVFFELFNLNRNFKC